MELINRPRRLRQNDSIRRLCREKNIRILREIPLSMKSDPLAWLADLWPNFFASTCVFILEK